MLGFGKTEVKVPEDRLADLQRKKDWPGVSRIYYELGVAAMDAGDLHKAHLWLHRADTIYSADDDIYDRVGEKMTDDCSGRIGRLEDEDGLFYNAVPAEIEARAEELDDSRVRVWGLLSIARLVRLGERLAMLPGCEVLGQLDWAVDLMFHSLQTLPSQEAYRRLMDMCNALYELNGKPVYYSGGIEVPGRVPFQLFDLNGMFGVEQELHGYTDSHLRLLAALSQGAKELPRAGSGIVACALLPDYYVRSGADRLEDVPQIRAELRRIWSDYDFVCGPIIWEEVGKRIAGYKQLDILKMQMDLFLFSDDYTVRRMEKSDVADIYLLCSKNGLYYQHCPPFVTEQSILDDMNALPPNKEICDKYYVGYYKGEELIAVMDFIMAYPDEKTAFIGFFMTAASIQNTGTGSNIIDDLCRYLADIGLLRVRLGWVKGNPQAEHFWHKNNFKETGITYDTDNYTVVVAQRVL